MPRINITEIDRTGAETYEAIEDIVLIPSFKLYGYDVDNNNELVTLDGVYTESGKLIEKINDIIALPKKYQDKVKAEYDKYKDNLKFKLETDSNKEEYYEISPIIDDKITISFLENDHLKSIKIMSEDTLASEVEIDLFENLPTSGFEGNVGAYNDIEIDATSGKYVIHTTDSGEDLIKVNKGTIITLKVVNYVKLPIDLEDPEWISNIERITGPFSDDDGKTAPLYSRDLAYAIAINLLDQGLPIQYAGLYDLEVDTTKTYSAKAKTLTEEEIKNFYKSYEDKGKYDIKFVTPGSLYEDVNVLMGCMQCAANRGDAIATLSLPQKDEIGKSINNTITIEEYLKKNLWDYSSKVPTRKTVQWAKTDTTETYGTYSAMFVPNIIMNFKNVATHANSTDFVNTVFPAYFNYLLCYAKHTVNNPDWFAIAGSIRGRSPKSFTTLIKFGDSDVDILEDRSEVANHVASNPICNIAPYGDVIWGNRTMHPLSVPNNGSADTIQLTASSFLNIRSLCCDIKKTIYRAGRRYSFDPNSDILWFNFKSAIKPLLERMLVNQGIRSYQILRVKTNKKALMVARVIITPIEAVEDFDIVIEMTDAIATTDALSIVEQ